MILGTQGNLQSLTGGLRLKVRIQHPGVHERTDRGGSYWYFRYWDDVLQPDGTTKAMRRFHVVGPSKGDNRLTKKQAEVERDKFVATINKPTKHEDYSSALIRHLLRDIIDNHPANELKISADDICNFLQNDGSLPLHLLFWRPLITGQMDADRADYLLRDSHHAGVAYGQYDINRLVATLRVVRDRETDSLMIGVETGGVQAVEALILARYMMFVQVYFHHTRRAYDHHVSRVLSYLLAQEYGDRYGERGTFPPPRSAEGQSTEQNLEEYNALDRPACLAGDPQWHRRDGWRAN